MRIIVVSDSHGDRFDLYRAIDKESTADYVFFLGDGYNEAFDASNVYSFRKQFYIVKGNCDLGSSAPTSLVATVMNKKIFATHGHLSGVKSDLYGLMVHAADTSADIVLYGHTHIQSLECVGGVYYFNPGSIRDYHYGVIDITEDGIFCEHKRLVDQ